jgi:type II secretory pathway component GspD/PulD (secretin)
MMPEPVRHVREGALVRGRFVGLVALGLIALTLGACAARRSYGRGADAARNGDWDSAVEYYRQAVQADPERAEYKIALERAMQNASFGHLARGRELEQEDQLDAALLEYKKASEYDPANRQAAAKTVELERTIRDRIEAARPQPPIVAMRERARQTEPILNPASREPLNIRFTNASLRDILNFIASASGINITYDPGVQDRPYSIQLDGVTLEEALQQILTANTLFYKVLNERTIIVIPETPANRAKYEEQVIRTFFLSHADATELAQIVNTVIRSPGMAVQPLIAPNKTANTITVRATAPVAAIIERLIETNDKPRAEVLIDVEILEVNRTRAKQFGLNLTQYAIGGVFSPEVRPRAPTDDDDDTPTIGAGTRPDQVDSPPLINFNTITRGVSPADFYLAVPAAVVRFLETDSQTKLIAKPQLRGAEGAKLTLNLGDEIPVPTTAFTPIAGGGANINPLTSFNYRPVGVNLEMTPRVTVEGDIILDLVVESSTLGEDVEVAGVTAPSFGSRKVSTRLRLRDGESNLLAGLLREDERRLVRGFPGAVNVPILKQLFSGNDTAIAQTDIVMLLTPRIVRTHELAQRDLNPIYIGTQQNLGLSGPPPLIAPPPEGTTPPPAEPGQPEPPPGATAAPGAAPTPPSAMPTFPPSSPTPGTINQPGAIPGAVPQPTTPAEPIPPAPEIPAPVAPAEVAGVRPATPPPGAAASQILVTPPGSEFRVAGGPYTVPISINGASRISTVSVTVMFNQTALRVRTVQEGSFMRQGGAAVTFTQQVDASVGRIDITVTRSADTTGASGSGLLAAVLFDAIGPGPSPLAVSGVATAPDGAPVPVQFVPASIVVR